MNYLGTSKEEKASLSFCFASLIITFKDWVLTAMWFCVFYYAGTVFHSVTCICVLVGAFKRQWRASLLLQTKWGRFSLGTTWGKITYSFNNSLTDAQQKLNCWLQYSCIFLFIYMTRLFLTVKCAFVAAMFGKNDCVLGMFWKIFLLHCCLFASKKKEYTT